MSLIIVEYLCNEHGRFDSLEERPAPDAQACPDCGGLCELVISAPLTRVKRGEVTKGKYEPPPSKNYLDTRELGEGMPLEEWKEKRKKHHEEQRRKELKELMSS